MKSIKVNAVLNILKTVCSIIFPLITIPYASRVLGAGNYGKVSFGNSIIQYFALFATLGVVTYAQREGPRIRDQKDNFREFASEVFTINFVATLLSYVVLFFLLMFSAKLKNYRMLILIQSFTIILTTIGTDWINTIYEDYFYITVRYLVIEIFSVLALFIFVRSAADYLLYAGISVVASAGGNLLNVFYVRRYTKVHFVPLQYCKKHLSPTLKLFAVSLASVIYVSSDITIIGLFKGDTQVGIYTLTSKIYTSIKTVLNAIMTVAIPRLAFYLGHQQEDEFNQLLKHIFNYLMTFILPVVCGLFMLSRPIIMLIGGREYISGTMSLQILSLAMFFSFFACFFSVGILLLYKYDNVYLVATLVSSITNIVLNFLLIPYLGINGAAFTTLLAEMIMMVISLVYALKIENIQKNKSYLFASSKVIISSIIGSFVILVECFIIEKFISNALIVIIISFIVGVALYALILAIFKNPVLISVLESLKRKIGKA